MECVLMNTWPNNIRQVYSQNIHKSYNSTHYPGTREICSLCGEPTGRCEGDSLYLFNCENDGPVCEKCYCGEV